MIDVPSGTMFVRQNQRSRKTNKHLRQVQLGENVIPRTSLSNPANTFCFSSNMTSASRAACRRLCTISKCFQLELTTVSPRFIRSFHSSTPRLTDGVFRALTEARVRTPWIEAFRKKKAEGSDPTKASNKPQAPTDRDLTPKRMSDSYHSVVSAFLPHPSPVKLIDPVIDLTTCSRSMAT